jgi:hypothetical protein
MKLTVKDAIIDLRTLFIGRIFLGYPDHKKLWKAEEINDAFTSAIYEVTMEYLERIEKTQEAPTNE